MGSHRETDATAARGSDSRARARIRPRGDDDDDDDDSDERANKDGDEGRSRLRKQEKKRLKKEKKRRKKEKRRRDDADADIGVSEVTNPSDDSQSRDVGGRAVPAPPTSGEDAALEEKPVAAARVEPRKTTKMSKADFFASLVATEAAKPPVGTFHATGRKDGGDDAKEKDSGDWECHKCSYVNFKECLTCSKCRALRRFEGRNQASGYCQ